MKKKLLIAAACSLPMLSMAQNPYGNGLNMEVFRTIAVIFVVGLFMVFILAIIKRFMDFRIKNKIVDKGVPENIITSLMEPVPHENRNSNIKWFMLLTGLGTALILIYWQLPLGIHSLAILAFSLAASFLGYYLFLRQVEK